MKKTFFIFFLYVWLETTWRLIKSPYKAIWEVRRHPVLFPVIFSPLINLFIIFICGKIAALLLVVYGAERIIIALILSVIFLSLLLWQLLLVYFLTAFLLVRQK